MSDNSALLITFDPADHQHIRYNPLKGEWVLVSPHRTKRPWSGQVESAEKPEIPPHDAENPLSPGSVRPNGVVNPQYSSTYVFDNDFPALVPHAPKPNDSSHPLFQIAQANGTCRVICFHPLSNVTIPTMSEDEIIKIINTWIDQVSELGTVYEWVQIFENKGEIMGCSNPHPHCQVWSSNYIPNEPRIKDKYQLEYYKEHGRPLLMDYVAEEILREDRLVCSNDDWVVLVPYWAVWPFETMVLPKVHIKRMTDLSNEQKESLAKIIKELTIRYDNIFQISFPYSMGWHGAPTGSHLDDNMEHWVFHGLYYPPLLRSATVKKFMVGYEMLAQAQRDFTPEHAAATLRRQSIEHYSTIGQITQPPSKVTK